MDQNIYVFLCMSVHYVGEGDFPQWVVLSIHCLSKCMPLPSPPTVSSITAPTFPSPTTPTFSSLTTPFAGPESCNEEFVGGMPIYGGFELDVFQSLVHFLRSEPKPLVPTGLYDLYMAVHSEF